MSVDRQQPESAEVGSPRCTYSGDGTPAACAARRGDKMCPVARLPTFPGSGPTRIRRPDALEHAGPRNIVASRFFISRLI